MEDLQTTDVEADGPPPILDETERAEPRKPSAPRRPAFSPHRPPSNTDLVREMHNADDRSIRDWIDSLAGEQEVRVTISRKRPTMGSRGENISGVLETVEDRIDEEYIREQWGGGDFQLKVQTLRPDGTFKYFRARTIKLAGPAKMNGKVVQELDGPSSSVAPAAMSDHDPLAERAFDSMERYAREAQQRADRAERDRQAGGLDIAALSTLQAPMIEQLRAAQATIVGLQQQMLELASRPQPRDEFRDRIMANALEGEGHRVEKLREQYEMRIDKLRDNFDDERKRMEDRHRDELKRIEDRHERELRFREKQEDAASKNTETANATRIEASQETIKRLERELEAAMKKIATLESTKNQTIGEKADELIKVKEALEGLGGGDDDKDDGPWYRQIIDAVGNSEAAMTWINKVTGGSPAEQQQAPQHQLPPPGIPYQTEANGPIYVRNAAGQVAVVDPATATRMAARARKRARRAQQAQQQPVDPGVAAAAASEAATAGAPTDVELEAALGGDPEPPPVKVRKPSKKDIEMAVQFAESALRNGDGDDKIIGFASTARNLIPGDILAYVQSVGSDAFITEATKSVPGSPLATIRGRQWLRKVFKYLVEGTL